jgi:O-antigen ligase
MSSLAYAALWIFIVSVPSADVAIGAAISRLAGVAALGLALLTIMMSGRLRRWDRFHVAAFLFVVWTGFGLLFLTMQGFLSDLNLVENQRKFWTFVQLLVAVWMVWELAPSRRHQIGLLTSYVLGTYVAAFNTILTYRKEANSARRFAAGGADPNDVAMTLALALPIAWYLGMTYDKPVPRWVCRAYLPLGLVALGLTGSRGGMVATVVALLIVPLSLPKLSHRGRTISIMLLILSGALAVRYVPETLLQRLAETTSKVEEGSFSGRVAIWKAGVKAFADKPLMGYGTAGFKKAVAPYIIEGGPRVAHNSFLSVLVEEGAIGFVLFALMFLAVFRAILDLPSMERRFGLVLLATLGVAMLPLTWEAQKPVWVILALLVGLSRAQVGPIGAFRQPNLQRAVPIPGQRRSARPMEPLTAPRRSADRDATA